MPWHIALAVQQTFVGSQHPYFLEPRCVQILAAEHRYKLLMTEKRSGGNKRKTPGEDDGEELPPKAASKAKSKPAVKAKAKAAN